MVGVRHVNAVRCSAYAVRCGAVRRVARGVCCVVLLPCLLSLQPLIAAKTKTKLSTHAARAPVHILLQVPREVVVDDVGQVADVQAWTGEAGSRGGSASGQPGGEQVQPAVRRRRTAPPLAQPVVAPHLLAKMRTRGGLRRPALAARMAARCFCSLAGFLCSAHTCTTCVTRPLMLVAPASARTRAGRRSHCAATCSSVSGMVAVNRPTCGEGRVKGAG